MNSLLLYLGVLMMLWAAVMAADTSNAVSKCQETHSRLVCQHTLNR